MTETVTLPRELVQQALKALENTSPLGFNTESDKKFYAAIAALRSALEQPQGEQEPVAWCELDADRRGIAYFDGKPIIMTGPAGNEHHPDPLYTQPQPKREPLTDEQIFDACESTGWIVSQGFAVDLARAIEAAHGIKEQK